MKKLYLLLIVIILAGTNQSCRKNTVYNLTSDVNVANDVILSVSSYTAVFNLLIKSRLNSSLMTSGSTYIDGAYITYDSVSHEYKFVFGTQISPDSVQRSGWIIVDLSGDLLRQGTYAKVTFWNYYEDYGEVSGNDSIVNEGTNALSQVVFHDYITHGTMDKGLGGGIIKVNINERLK
ncbi:MAG: hypothetical protein ABSD71_13265, partial [Bacteroidales bacterium]